MRSPAPFPPAQLPLSSCTRLIFLSCTLSRRLAPPLQLKSVFGFCGTIRTCTLAGANSGFAFLEFSAAHEAGTWAEGAALERVEGRRDVLAEAWHSTGGEMGPANLHARLHGYLPLCPTAAGVCTYLFMQHGVATATTPAVAAPPAYEGGRVPLSKPPPPIP